MHDLDELRKMKSGDTIIVILPKRVKLKERQRNIGNQIYLIYGLSFSNFSRISVVLLFLITLLFPAEHISLVIAIQFGYSICLHTAYMLLKKHTAITKVKVLLAKVE